MGGAAVPFAGAESRPVGDGSDNPSMTSTEIQARHSWRQPPPTATQNINYPALCHRTAVARFVLRTVAAREQPRSQKGSVANDDASVTCVERWLSIAVESADALRSVCGDAAARRWLARCRRGRRATIAALRRECPQVRWRR